MAWISELALERAKNTLMNVHGARQDSFEGELANMALLLLPRAFDENFTRIPKRTALRLSKKASEHLEELGKVGDIREVDRQSLFWAFFHLAALHLAASYFAETFSATDVALDDFIQTNQAEFRGDERQRINYLLYRQPRDLLRDVFSLSLEEGGKTISNDLAKLASENDRSTGLLKQLDVLTTRAQDLEAVIKGQTQKLNFVGLSHGFSQMASECNAAIKTPLTLLTVCVVLLVVTPLGSLALFISSGARPGEWWPAALSFAAIEVVLLYFFRVVLTRYQSLKAQLLQLDLRQALCAFVESYAEFAQRTRKGDDKILERFEALVFSGITPDPQAVPSHLDGIDSLTALAKAFRGKDN